MLNGSQNPNETPTPEEVNKFNFKGN